MPGFASRTLTVVGVPGDERGARGLRRGAAGGGEATSPLVRGADVELTGYSAPETAVGGSAVIGPKTSAAVPRRSGPAAGPLRLPAAISIARSCAGVSSGRCCVSLAAMTATRAAATALAADHDGPPADARGDGAAVGGEVGLRRARPRSGPATCWARSARPRGASDFAPALGVAEADRGAGLGLQELVRGVAGDADHRDRGPAGGHRGQRLVSPGAAITTALRPDRGGGRGLGGRVRTRLDDHDLAADAGQEPCRAWRCRCR